ncbi:hypothetical protein [Kibdelosporangium persicum]|uniref:hypothetical protein n=1 Tax=Kibdelosporangium persicum TaxID=2698649 RepID=UPI001564FC67|nr:hypothetical protein [Kibdelosporangium persicum]
MTYVLGAVLRDAMINRLATLDALAHKANIQELSAAIREILALHQPDSHGRCRGCSHRWRRQHHKFPCRVWLIAHRHLLTPARPVKEFRRVQRGNQ